MALSDVTASGDALATRDDLALHGCSSQITEGISDANLDAMLASASEEAAGILQSSGRVKLPLTAWGADLTKAVCKLTAWDIMTSLVGHNPGDANNFVWRDRAAEARDWLEKVARGLIMPVGLVDATPTVTKTGSVVVTETQRGWR
jgi:phage gp36-like protein